MNRRKLVILGATGSIGWSTLDVVARHPERYEVFALTAYRQCDRLATQCIRFQPRFAVVAKDEDRRRLIPILREAGCATEVLVGEAGLIEVAAHPEAEIVMAAIVGAAGLLPTLAAAQAGKQVLLANKEALVLAGGLFMRAVRENGATLLPIDSEHNAVFQALPHDYHGCLNASGVRRIILTASGGPFRDLPVAQLRDVTPEQACAHPNWTMGRKISVDSATMMNKGLEVIEAHWIFAAAPEAIEVAVHPQSVVHSMVEYVDGSVMAQLGNPDMRTPIAHALGYPERIAAGVAWLDLFEIGRLTFERPDPERFRCLGLAYAALREQGAAAAILNAANEEAVAAFLERKLDFCAIAEVIEATLEHPIDAAVDSVDAILEADRRARQVAREKIGARAYA